MRKKSLYIDLKSYNTLSVIADLGVCGIPAIAKVLNLPYHIVRYRLDKLSKMGYVTKIDVHSGNRVSNCLWEVKNIPTKLTIKNASVAYSL